MIGTKDKTEIDRNPRVVVVLGLTATPVERRRTRPFLEGASRPGDTAVSARFGSSVRLPPGMSPAEATAILRGLVEDLLTGSAGTGTGDPQHA